MTFPEMKMVSQEYSGIFQSPKAASPNKTITESIYISNCPRGSLVYLAKIMATISDPPVVALERKTSPSPNPIRTPPKIQESRTSPSTSGTVPQTSICRSMKPAVRKNPRMVLMPNLGPRTRIPIMVRGMFMISPINPTGNPSGANLNMPSVR